MESVEQVSNVFVVIWCYCALVHTSFAVMRLVRQGFTKRLSDLLSLFFALVCTIQVFALFLPPTSEPLEIIVNRLSYMFLSPSFIAVAASLYVIMSRRVLQASWAGAHASSIAFVSFITLHITITLLEAFQVLSSPITSYVYAASFVVASAVFLIASRKVSRYVDKNTTKGQIKCSQLQQLLSRLRYGKAWALFFSPLLVATVVVLALTADENVTLVAEYVGVCASCISTVLFAFLFDCETYTKNGLRFIQPRQIVTLYRQEHAGPRLSPGQSKISQYRDSPSESHTANGKNNSILVPPSSAQQVTFSSPTQTPNQTPGSTPPDSGRKGSDEMSCTPSSQAAAPISSPATSIELMEKRGSVSTMGTPSTQIEMQSTESIPQHMQHALLAATRLSTTTQASSARESTSTQLSTQCTGTASTRGSVSTVYSNSRASLTDHLPVDVTDVPVYPLPIVPLPPLHPFTGAHASIKRKSLPPLPPLPISRLLPSPPLSPPPSALNANASTNENTTPRDPAPASPTLDPFTGARSSMTCTRKSLPPLPPLPISSINHVPLVSSPSLSPSPPPQLPVVPLPSISTVLADSRSTSPTLNTDENENKSPREPVKEQRPVSPQNIVVSVQTIDDSPQRYENEAKRIMNKLELERSKKLAEKVALSIDMAQWWRRKTTLREFFTFPNPVNMAETRMHAGCSSALIVGIIVMDYLGYPPILLYYMTYGFLARILCGPRVDPQAFIMLFILRPIFVDKLKLFTDSFGAGPPRRFAQFVGFMFSAVALVFRLAMPSSMYVPWMYWTLAICGMCTFLQFTVNVCLGCAMFYVMMKLHLISESACEECRTAYNVTSDILSWEKYAQDGVELTKTSSAH